MHDEGEEHRQNPERARVHAVYEPDQHGGGNQRRIADIDGAEEWHVDRRALLDGWRTVGGERHNGLFDLISHRRVEAHPVPVGKECRGDRRDADTGLAAVERKRSRFSSSFHTSYASTSSDG